MFWALFFLLNIKNLEINNAIFLADPDNSILTNTKGLVNYTCDSLEYVDWTKNGKYAGICLQTTDADHGSFTRNNGAKVRLSFVGKKVHILGWKQENSGRCSIRIDNQVVATPNFGSGGGRHAAITFTSDELPFGEHVIEVEHSDTDDAKSMVIGGAYVDPLPNVGGYKLSYENFAEREGQWKLNGQTNLPSFSCESEDCSGVFRFYGARFWLTGVRSSSEGNLQIQIDNGQPITITKSVESRFTIGQGNHGVLLYQSSVLSLGFHKVKVTRTNQKITLNNLFYTTNDGTQLPLPPVNTSVMTNPTGLINLTCDKFSYEGWDTGGRGGVCIKTGEADHGSFTRNTNGKATLQFVGSKVHILAWKQENSGNAEIRIDGELVSTTNFNSGGGRLPGIVFSSSDLQYGSHTLEIKHVDTFNAKSVVIGGAYVDPLPYYGGYALTLDGLMKKYGNWSVKTATTPPLFACNSENCAGTFVFYGTRFWLTGLRSSNIGKFQIQIDDGQRININAIQTLSIAQGNIPYLLYQSDELEFKEHEVKIYKTDKEIQLVNFFYTIYPYARVPPPTPTPTPEATPQPGTKPTEIVVSTVSSLPTDRRFEKEVDDFKSIKVSIYISEFKNVYHNDKGGAIHIVNGGLSCEETKFTHCQSSNGAGGAIYLSNDYNYQNSFNLNELVFTDCKAQYGGCIYLYHVSSNIDAKITRCEFHDSQALATKQNPFNGKYGGGAIYITSPYCDMTGCKFYNIKGNVVKLVNSFTSPQSSLKLLSKSFTINDCTFDMTKQTSSALFYLSGNSKTSVVVNDCTFKGQLADGNYYLDGQSNNKNAPKLIVRKCRFAAGSDKLIKENALNEILSVDLKDQVFDYKDFSEYKDKNSKKKLIILAAVLVPAAVLAIIAVTVFTLKRKNPSKVDDKQVTSHDASQVTDKLLNAQLL